MDHVDPEVRYWSRRPLQPSDCARAPEPAEGNLEIDCCYRFLWGSFTVDDRAELGRADERLPGWAGDAHGPRWFNPDGNEPPFLTASVEPLGSR